jgi:hypothetical protein
LKGNALKLARNGESENKIGVFGRKIAKTENAKYARLQQCKRAKTHSSWALGEYNKIIKNSGEWFVKEKVADGVGLIRFAHLACLINAY